MDAQDKKELNEYVSRRPAPSMLVSLVLHACMILFMLLYGLDAPEVLKPIIIEMSQKPDDLIEIDDEPYVNQAMVDWFDKIEQEQQVDIAETVLPPDLKPADISPITDPIFNPEPQAGTSALTDVLPSDLMTNLAPERMGSNTDMMEVGNPMAGTSMDGGTGGNGEVGGMIQKLEGLGAKTGKVTVSLFWNTMDDLDLHLVKQTDLPVRGQWFQGMCCFNHRKTYFAELDIDMNVFPKTNDAVENIYVPHNLPGRYGIYVHFFKRHTRNKSVRYTVLFQEEGKEPVTFHGTVNFTQHNYASKRIHTFWIKHDKSGLLQPPSEPEEPEFSSPFTGI